MTQANITSAENDVVATLSPSILTPVTLVFVKNDAKAPPSYAKLRELAKRHQPPRSWYEEKVTGSHE